MSSVYTTTTLTATQSSPLSSGAKLVHHLNGYTQPMDGRQPKYEAEYTQSGLSPSYPTFPGPVSEGSPADQASAAQYTPGQDPRASNFSSSATPTSEYGLAPSSARSGSFPDYIQRGYHQSSGQTTPAGGMAQATSPSSLLQDGQASSNAHNSVSNGDLPIDPSIAAASPTYTPHQPPYSPYGPPPHDMSQHYQQHAGMYGRPDWSGQQQYPPQHPHMPHHGYATSAGGPSPAMVSPVQRPPTVCPFFPFFSSPVLPPFLQRLAAFTILILPAPCGLEHVYNADFTSYSGRTPNVHCLLLCSHTWCAAAQASTKTL